MIIASMEIGSIVKRHWIYKVYQIEKKVKKNIL